MQLLLPSCRFVMCGVQLGATLYCLSVGRPPYMANSAGELEKLLCGPDEPLYPKDLLPSLRNLLRRMLTKSPEKRITLPEVLVHPWVTSEGTGDVHGHDFRDTLMIS
jgi:calcium/calmodulin-dependent protein kinase kinase 2